ncbi:hypothetical protein C5167_047462 [Papaver somniferum]|uniref:Uncharacterized protein n=1 Tax=Papaver somniferum TaxID=3469 RepID=A0A4Y7LHF2_PAPSO|nr:hypothetical protein C5167_047462 [Papaver somniferum]
MEDELKSLQDILFQSPATKSPRQVYQGRHQANVTEGFKQILCRDVSYQITLYAFDMKWKPPTHLQASGPLAVLAEMKIEPGEGLDAHKSPKKACIRKEC